MPYALYGMATVPLNQYSPHDVAQIPLLEIIRTIILKHGTSTPVKDIIHPIQRRVVRLRSEITEHLQRSTA